MSNCIDDREALVRESLLAFLQENIPQADLSHVDEYVSSYVVRIVEELGFESGHEELFDVESFSEMLTAYFPEFISVPHVSICNWIFQLSDKALQNEKDVKANSVDRGLKFPPLMPVKIERSPRVSECSDASTDSITDIQFNTQPFDRENENVNLLIEMFPLICLSEAVHCLSLSNGSLDEAAQLVLHRQEIGQSITQGPENLCPPHNKSRPVNEKTLRKKIIDKYSYIDQDDDQREHRPPPPKHQPKKMVRYLDNKVVSIKGERYTEIKEDSETKDDVKKTYVSLKPARQYRFH